MEANLQFKLEDNSSQDRLPQNRSSQDRSSQDRSSKGRSSQDRSGQDSHDRSSQDHHFFRPEMYGPTCLAVLFLSFVCLFHFGGNFNFWSRFLSSSIFVIQRGRILPGFYWCHWHCRFEVKAHLQGQTLSKTDSYTEILTLWPQLCSIKP